MKKKALAYLTLPVVAAVLLGVGTASAHGWFGSWRTMAPEEIASQHKAMFQEQADLLGMSVAEVTEAWSQGKSITQIAQEKGISESDLASRMRAGHLAHMKEQLQTLVSQGVITQAQADARAKLMETRMQNGFTGKGPRHMHMMW